ncbi:MAG TPA: hypothetical protein VL443_14830 [Cyclobacteriaceae bacterium]|jgi:hypothetical protein|nr:hypothetical protein [Cyclobacteriaceae bacterium]
MKRNIILLALVLITSFSYSQKIQLKKGLLSKDDVPLGKLEGEATLLKGTNISIQSMEGLPLIIIKDPLVTFGSPYHEPIRYYSIKFIPLDKTVSFIPDQKKFFTSEKKLVEYLFENIGKDFLSASGLNAELVDQFITRRDQSQKIAKDTLHISNLIKASQEKIMEPLVDRPENGDVELVSLEKETINATWRETLETFNILKGKVLIGRVTKFYKGDPSLNNGSTTPQSKDVVYVVMRKINSFMLDGEKIEFINLVKVKSSVNGPDVYSYCERKDLKITDIYSAEYQIVSQLVTKMCL